jgi:hypothetical protein
VGVLISGTIRREDFRMSATSFSTLDLAGDPTAWDGSECEAGTSWRQRRELVDRYSLRGRLGVVGATFAALGLRVAAATARTDAVFPFALRAVLACLGDSFTWAVSM